MGRTVTIYIPEDFEETWRKFMEICRRERGKNREGGASSQIRDWVTPYVDKKYPGNPQPPLEKFFKVAVTIPHKDCCADCVAYVTRTQFCRVQGIKVAVDYKCVNHRRCEKG